MVIRQTTNPEVEITTKPPITTNTDKHGSIKIATLVVKNGRQHTLVYISFQILTNFRNSLTHKSQVMTRGKLGDSKEYNEPTRTSASKLIEILSPWQ